MIAVFLKAYLFSSRANSHVKKMAWISLSGIVLGTFSLIVVLSIMSGLNLATEKRLLMHEPHLVVQGLVKNIDQILKNFKGVQSTFVFETQDVLLKSPEGLFNGSEAVGLSSDGVKRKPSFYHSDGSPLAYELSEFDDGEGVFIGFDLSLELNLVIGDSFQVYKPESIIKGQMDFSPTDTKTVRVLGVLNSESGSRESRLIIYRRGKLFQGDSLSLNEGHEIYLEEPQKAQKIKIALADVGVESETWKDRNAVLFLALKLEKLAMTFLLGLALLITSFSIMTLLVLIVVQKQKDIGILLSMGLSRFQVRALFGGLGAGVSLCGISLGAVLGTVVSVLLDLFPVKVLPAIYQDPYLPAEFSLFTVGWVLFFCAFVAILSSLVPIFYLSKVTPVSALRESLRF
jgi:lipoprotein-releasing system permease protein